MILPLAALCGAILWAAAVGIGLWLIRRVQGSMPVTMELATVPAPDHPPVALRPGEHYGFFEALDRSANTLRPCLATLCSVSGGALERTLTESSCGLTADHLGEHRWIPARPRRPGSSPFVVECPRCGRS